MKLKKKAIDEMGSNSSEEEEARDKQKRVDVIKQRFQPAKGADLYPGKDEPGKQNKPPVNLVSSTGSNNYQRLIQA